MPEKLIGFQERNNKIEFLENSKLIDEALSKYKEFEKGNISEEDLNLWLRSDDAFSKHDKESFNCHSFVLMVMKHELGLDKIETFEDVEQNKENWTSEDGEFWEEGYREDVCNRSPDEKDERMRQLEILERNVIDNSEEFALRGYKQKNETINKIIDKIKNGDISRFAFMFLDLGKVEKEFDYHSFIILGLNKNEDDIIVLEKQSPGDTIRLTTMSNVFIKAMTGSSVGMKINIPTKNITGLYPKGE